MEAVQQKIEGPVTKHYLLVALLALVLFVPFLGQVHLFDWDEINFAESAREMIETGVYSRVQVNFMPFWEKPPLFIWMQVLSMKAFGINEFAARFPNAICGLVSLLVLFHTGRKYFSTAFGWIWVLVYAGSLLPHFYFRSGIIDPWFNLWMFLGVLQLVKLSFKAEELATDIHRMKHVLLAGLFLGLAILTKGPVGLLLPLLSLAVYMIVTRDIKVLSVIELGVLGLTAAVVSSVWYGWETLQNGWWFLEEFIDYHLRLMQTEDSGHGQPIYYHFVVVLLGCFPASFLLFPSLRKNLAENELQAKLRKWMTILMLVVLIVFSLIKTKIVHYSSMTYLPLTFLASLFIYRLYECKSKLSNVLRVAMFIYALILGTAFTLLPIVGNNTDLIAPYIKDDFAVANLSVSVPWPSYYVVVGIVFLLVVVYAFVVSGKQKFKGVIIYFIASGLLLNISMSLFTPLIEPFTQGAAIEFMEEHADEDVYINVLGYKSYAHYFYGRKDQEDTESPLLKQWVQSRIDNGKLREWPSSNEMMSEERLWHLYGNIDKPVYFVVKNIKYEGYKEQKDLQKIGEKGGFVFLKRDP